MSHAETDTPDGSFVLRIAVASDLHAYSASEVTDGPTPSHLEVLSGDTSAATNPILGLRDLIAAQNLKADLIVCPGDLGDKASPQGIQFAWQKVHEIGEWLGASQVLATTGNHDVDSRHKDNDVDPHQVVKNLTPPYPTPDEEKNNAYFARDFVLIEESHYRLVLLNTSAHHGTTEQEDNHGRITRTTVDSLRGKLATATAKPLSILLCHHHPHQHSELNLGSADVMLDGQLLLDLLSSDAASRWLIIHGHKHHPKITYAAGGASSPVVFAAGSLCAELFKELQTATKNQFHIVTSKSGELNEYGLVGTIESWYWSYGKGWEPSQPGSGLPRQCGFGFRGDLQGLARQILSVIGNNTVVWSVLLGQVPELAFLLPQDFLMLKTLLDKNGVGIQDQDGLPYQIGRRKS
jgi:3',5'-cyclic AMP phosphodiesterase CpdA